MQMNKTQLYRDFFVPNHINQRKSKAKRNKLGEPGFMFYNTQVG